MQLQNKIKNNTSQTKEYNVHLYLQKDPDISNMYSSHAVFWIFFVQTNQ